MSFNLHYFNPGHENAVLNGSPYYMAPANVVKMQSDLEYLPAWYADEKDYVYTSKDLTSFTNFFLGNNLNIAKSVTTNTISLVSSNFTVFPWGLSPQIVHFFNTIEEELNIQLKIPRWNSALYDLTSRINSKICLEFLASRIVEIKNDIIPAIFSDLPEIESYLQKSDNRLLAKSPFSSSGRGLLWLPEGHLSRTEKQILSGILKKQTCVLIEKTLDKKLDFAMEFFITENSEVNFAGYSLFHTSSRGAYLGNVLDSQGNIENSLTKLIDKNILEKTKEALIHFIQQKFSYIYSGYIGVDMMIYEEDKELRLQPCVEMNVRNNMGVIAINLTEKYIDSQSKGLFIIDYNSKAGGIYKSDQEMKEKYPLVFSSGKIKSGYTSLCPIKEYTNYRAYILVE